MIELVSQGLAALREKKLFHQPEDPWNSPWIPMEYILQSSITRSLQYIFTVGSCECRATQDLDQASLQHILRLATKHSHKAMKFQTKRITHTLMQYVSSYILPRRTEDIFSAVADLNFKSKTSKVPRHLSEKEWNRRCWPSKRQHIEFFRQQHGEGFLPKSFLQPQCQSKLSKNRAS